MRVLFILETTRISGGNKILFELINRCVTQAIAVEVLSFEPQPDWFDLQVPIRRIDANEPNPVTAMGSALSNTPYDILLLSNVCLLPMCLPWRQSTPIVLFCQGYEEFCYGDSYAELMQEKPLIGELIRLPQVHLIATSASIQTILTQRTGKPVYTIPCGIDKQCFSPTPVPVAPRQNRRILMIGRIGQRLKGIPDGLEAVRKLAEEIPVELVLISPEELSATALMLGDIPVEIHVAPNQAAIAEIIRSCDVYCCSSWYEGLGLPALEAFHCGTPVVSTRHSGVGEYGRDGENILLANIQDPQDLSRQLKRILSDSELSKALAENALTTVQNRYHWHQSEAALLEALRHIVQLERDPPPFEEEVSAAQSEHYLESLENQGLFYPPFIYARLQAFSVQLKTLMFRIQQESPLQRGSSKSLLSETDYQQLSEICLSLQPWAENRTARYYETAKTQLDCARFLLNFQEAAIQRSFTHGYRHVLAP